MKRVISWFLIFVLLVPPTFAQQNYGGTAVSGTSLDFPNGGYAAASNTFPINTVLEVTNPSNGKSIQVTITNRLSESGVFILLSPRASQDLGIDDSFPFSVSARTVSLPTVTSTNGEADLPFSRDPDLNPQASLGDPNEFLYTEGDKQAEIENPFAEIIANLEDTESTRTTDPVSDIGSSEDLILGTDDSDIIAQTDPDLDPDFTIDVTRSDSRADTSDNQVIDNQISDISSTDNQIGTDIGAMVAERRAGINSGISQLSDPGAIQTQFIPYNPRTESISTDISDSTEVITSDIPDVESVPELNTTYFVQALQRINTNAYSQLPNSLAPEQESLLLTGDSPFEEARRASGPMGILAGVGRVTRDSRSELPEFEIGRPDHIFWPEGFSVPESRISLSSDLPNPALADESVSMAQSDAETSEDPFYRGGQEGTLEENLQAIASQLPERQLFLPPRFTGSDSSIQRPDQPLSSQLSFTLPRAGDPSTADSAAIAQSGEVDAGIPWVQARVVRVAESELPLVNFSTGERPMAESFPRIGAVQGRVVSDGFSLPTVGLDLESSGVVDAGIVRIENIQEPLPVYRLLSVTPPGEVRVEEGLSPPEVGSFPSNQLALSNPQVKEFAVENPSTRLSAPIDEILVYTMEPADHRPPQLQGLERNLEDLSDEELANVESALLTSPSSEVGETLGRQASLHEPNRQTLNAQSGLNPFARESVRAQFEAEGLARLQSQVDEQRAGDPVGPENVVKLTSPDEEPPLSDREESGYALREPLNPDRPRTEVVYVEVPVESTTDSETRTVANDLIVYLERAESRPPGTSTNDIKPLETRDSTDFAVSLSDSSKPGLEWARENLPLVANLESEQFYLQFGAFNDPRTARQALDGVEIGFPFAVVPIGDTPVYRVFVGPLTDDEKGSVLYWFRAKGFRDAFIRKGGPS